MGYSGSHLYNFCSHASNPLLQITINLKPSDCIGQQFPQARFLLTPRSPSHKICITDYITGTTVQWSHRHHRLDWLSPVSCPKLATQPPPLVLHARLLRCPWSKDTQRNLFFIYMKTFKFQILILIFLNIIWRHLSELMSVVVVDVAAPFLPRAASSPLYF